MNEDLNQKEINKKEDKQELSLTTSTEKVDVLAADLVNQIVKCESKEELENLYSQFKINNTKKNAIRITELNKLLDSVNSEAVKRFKESSDTMTNREVLDYMNGIQNQIDRSQQIVEGISEINAVQVNNTQNNTVNIHVGDQDLNNLNRESRNRITSFISDILKQGAISEDIIDVSEDKTVVENTDNGGTD